MYRINYTQQMVRSLPNTCPSDYLRARRVVSQVRIFRQIFAIDERQCVSQGEIAVAVYAAVAWVIVLLVEIFEMFVGQAGDSLKQK